MSATFALPLIAAALATATPECKAPDLAGALTDGEGAAGSQFARLILINTSSRTCHTKGFVGARFTGTDGKAIAAHVTRDSTTAAKTVTIKPGAAAAAQLRWSLVPSGSSPCKKARWLRVIPPDDTRTVRVYFNSTPCRGELQVRALTVA